jgi:hypothetical protein
LPPEKQKAAPCQPAQYPIESTLLLRLACGALDP